MMDYSITLPSGAILEGGGPVVVIGPNGSGKTRQTRNLASPAPIEFINALRNTRVAPELPAVGMETARNTFTSQRNQAKSQHWELTNEFDYMLSQLLAQKSMAAIEFTRRFERDPAKMICSPKRSSSRQGREARRTDSVLPPSTLRPATARAARLSMSRVSGFDKRPLSSTIVEFSTSLSQERRLAGFAC